MCCRSLHTSLGPIVEASKAAANGELEWHRCVLCAHVLHPAARASWLLQPKQDSPVTKSSELDLDPMLGPNAQDCLKITSHHLSYEYLQPVNRNVGFTDSDSKCLKFFEERLA